MSMIMASEYLDVVLSVFGQIAADATEAVLEAVKAPQASPIHQGGELVRDGLAPRLPGPLGELNTAVGSLEFALAVVVSLTALAAWVNDRFLRVPTAIVALVAGFVYALITLLLVSVGVIDHNYLRELLATFQFQEVVLHGLLGFILFAAALQVDLGKLKKAAWSVAYLSTFGVLIFILIWSVLIWALILGMNQIWPSLGHLEWLGCVALAAILAPTDAAAVVSIMRRVKAPERLRLIVAGESLFNDAVSIVLFLVAAQLWLASSSISEGQVTVQLVRELIGGLLLGGFLGLIGLVMLRGTVNSSTRVLITVGIVLGGTCAAIVLGTSGPLAMVVAGILMGEFAQGGTKESRHATASFWDVVDQVLNGVLFMLLGLELLALKWDIHVVIASVAVFPLIHIARYLSLWLPSVFMPRKNRFSHGQLVLLTWCGLRGGVSVALALALGSELIAEGTMDPEMLHDFKTNIHPAFILSAFTLVTMSMLIQGLTAPIVVRRSRHMDDPDPE